MPNREVVFQACGEELHLLFTHDARRELEVQHKLPIGAVPNALHTAVGLEALLLWGLEGWRRANAPTTPAWTEQRVRALLAHAESPTHYEWAKPVDHAFNLAIKLPVIAGDKAPEGAGGPKAP